MNFLPKFKVKSFFEYNDRLLFLFKVNTERTLSKYNESLFLLNIQCAFPFILKMCIIMCILTCRETCSLCEGSGCRVETVGEIHHREKLESLGSLSHREFKNINSQRSWLSQSLLDSQNLCCKSFVGSSAVCIF